MFMKKELWRVCGLTLLIAGMQGPAQAQTTTPETVQGGGVQAINPSENLNSTVASIEAAAWTATEHLSAEALLNEETAVDPLAQQHLAEETANLATSANEGNIKLAQARRRTRGANGGPDFIGVGADFGYVDDVSFAVISKISVNELVALRPSILLGDDLAILLPITYQFNQFAAGTDNFQLRPYVGIGASYVDSDDDDDDEDFNLLLAAGADIPLGQRFTLNAQANLGVLNDTDFGGTVGIGYNFGRIFR